MRKVQLTFLGKILLNAIIAFCVTMISDKHGLGFLATIGISFLCQIPLFFGDKIIKLVSNVKKYFTKRKASKHYRILLEARGTLQMNLDRMTTLMEFKVNSPAFSEEEKIKIVDTFLTKKDKFENMLTQLNSIIDHYRYFRDAEFNYGHMNLVRASLIHDSLEDMAERVNYNIEQFENEHFTDLINSINSKSHTLDVMNESSL